MACSCGCAHLPKSAVPGSPIDEQKPDQQGEQQHGDTVGTGNTSQKTQAPNKAANAANQNRVAAATPAITSRNGSSRTTTATTSIPNISCSRIIATSRWRGLDGRQRPAGPLVSMESAFAANLIGGIGHGGRIKRLPAGFAVEVAALPKLHRGLVHHRRYSRHVGRRYSRGNQC